VKDWPASLSKGEFLKIPMKLKSPIQVAKELYTFYRASGHNENDSKERLCSVMARDLHTYSLALMDFILKEIENEHLETD
jgi:hypothetical protein